MARSVDTSSYSCRTMRYTNKVSKDLLLLLANFI